MFTLIDTLLKICSISHNTKSADHFVSNTDVNFCSHTTFQLVTLHEYKNVTIMAMYYPNGYPNIIDRERDLAPLVFSK